MALAKDLFFKYYLYIATSGALGLAIEVQLRFITLGHHELKANPPRTGAANLEDIKKGKVLWD